MAIRVLAGAARRSGARRHLVHRLAPSAGGGVPVGAYVAVLACAALCYAAMGGVLRILPRYVPHDLGAGPLALGLAVGAPALTAIVLRPAGGRWADRHGPLPVLLVGAVTMAAGAPLALVGDLPLLIVSRLVVGGGEGLMMSAAALWLLRLGGENRRGRSMGHVGLANYGGLVIGPLLAMAIAGEAHPSRVFLVSCALPVLGALVVLAARPGMRGPGGEERPASVREVLAWTLRPGGGLMLVNIGYAALLSFGAAAIAANGAGAAGLVVPVFAAVVFAVRALAGSIPDRAGAQRTLAFACPIAAAGLCGVALLASTPLVLLSLVVLAAGQALSVPALGVLALRRAPASQHGAAAGLFFAWFDAGVGLGGPIAGVAARLSDAPGALITAGALVAIAPLLAGALPLGQKRRRAAPRRRPTRRAGPAPAGHRGRHGARR